MENTKLSVTLDTEQLDKAICKTNELIDTINKAKTISNDLAYILQNLNFKPTIIETQEDER